MKNAADLIEYISRAVFYFCLSNIQDWHIW